MAPSRELFKNPKHSYTKALLSSIPSIDPEKKSDAIALKGEIPSALNPPSGCIFHTRCRYTQDICKTEIPPYRDLGDSHFAACHFTDSLQLNSGTL